MVAGVSVCRNIYALSGSELICRRSSNKSTEIICVRWTNLKAFRLSWLISVEFRPQMNWFSPTMSGASSSAADRLLYLVTPFHTDVNCWDKTHVTTVTYCYKYGNVCIIDLWIIPATLGNVAQNIERQRKLLQLRVREALRNTPQLHDNTAIHLGHWAKGLQEFTKNISSEHKNQSARFIFPKMFTKTTDKQWMNQTRGVFSSRMSSCIIPGLLFYREQPVGLKCSQWPTRGILQ